MKMDKIILFLMISALITLMFYYRVQTVEIPEVIEETVIRKVVKVTIEPVKIPDFEGKTFKSKFTINKIDDIIYNRINKSSYHENNYIKIDDLRYLEITYWGYDNKKHIGELIVHQLVANDVIDIFKELYSEKFLINEVVLIDNYEADDEFSMNANNTSAFNYRIATGSTKLSNHAYGLAIDINPMQNPYIYGENILPIESAAYIDRSNYQAGMIIKNDVCYNAFTTRGWKWGGNWTSIKDYQHFEITIKGIN